MLRKSKEVLYKSTLFAGRSGSSLSRSGIKHLLIDLQVLIGKKDNGGIIGAQSVLSSTENNRRPTITEFIFVRQRP
jgi:hypothetical protein